MLSSEYDRNMQKSLEYYEQAVKLLEEVYERPETERLALPKEQQVEDGYHALKIKLSESYQRVGVTYYVLGEPTRAIPYALKTMALRQKMVTEACAGQAAWCLTAKPGVPDSLLAVAASLPSQSKDVNEQRDLLSKTYHLVAEVYRALRDLEQSRTYYSRCLSLRQAILEADPRNFVLKGTIAMAMQMYADMNLSLGDARAALQVYEDSVKLTKQLIEVDKDVEYPSLLSMHYYGMGQAYTRQQNPALAQKYFGDSLQIREKLAEPDPNNVKRQMYLMEVLPHCGQHVRAANLAERLRRGREKDLELSFYVARTYAQCAAAASSDAIQRRSYEEKALASLVAAVASGYKDLFKLETNPDLDPIRSLPEFKKLLEKVKAGTAAVAKAL
jgi:tetratricopeptide (TPR) repeat protein